MARRQTVLVVEDDASLRHTLSEMLEEAGLRVIAARNGVEAHALAEADPPAAIVLDLIMPVAGGWHFLQRLRAEGFGGIPVVLFSGSIDLEAEAERLGASRWIQKPCQPRVLLEAVHAVLLESAGATEVQCRRSVVDRRDALSSHVCHPARRSGSPGRLRRRGAGG